MDKRVSSIGGAGKTGQLHVKRMKSENTLIPNTKLTEIIGSSVRAKIITFRGQITRHTSLSIIVQLSRIK